MTDRDRDPESDGRDDDPGRDESEPVTERLVLDAMAPAEPYTLGELAAALDRPRRRVGALLERLVADGPVVEKPLPDGPTVWVRRPPMQRCPECGRAFELRFRHAVLAAARFCPRCGAALGAD